MPPLKKHRSTSTTQEPPSSNNLDFDKLTFETTINEDMQFDEIFEEKNKNKKDEEKMLRDNLNAFNDYIDKCRNHTLNNNYFNENSDGETLDILIMKEILSFRSNIATIYVKDFDRSIENDFELSSTKKWISSITKFSNFVKRLREFNNPNNKNIDGSIKVDKYLDLFYILEDYLNVIDRLVNIRKDDLLYCYRNMLYFNIFTEKQKLLEKGELLDQCTNCHLNKLLMMIGSNNLKLPSVVLKRIQSKTVAVINDIIKKKEFERYIKPTIESTSENELEILTSDFTKTSILDLNQSEDIDIDNSNTKVLERLENNTKNITEDNIDNSTKVNNEDLYDNIFNENQRFTFNQYNNETNGVSRNESKNDFIYYAQKSNIHEMNNGNLSLSGSNITPVFTGCLSLIMLLVGIIFGVIIFRKKKLQKKIKQSDEEISLK